jgi:hypothetical protein
VSNSLDDLENVEMERQGTTVRLMTKQLMAVAATILSCASYAAAAPRPVVQRGTSIVVETRFNQDFMTEVASLTWQMFDPISPRQEGMARAFRCDADIVANGENGLKLSCKVPLDVADGDYYLTSLFVRANTFERTYNWINERLDLHVQVKGGQELPLPQVRSVQLK